MRYLAQLALALLLAAGGIACDEDDPAADAGPADGGASPADTGIVDSGITADGGVDAGIASRLDRPGLPRPPSNGLPSELRPPR